MSTTTEALIDAVTREVLAALAGRGDGCDCADGTCQGACAAHHPDKVRGVVSNGAERISYSGDGAEVPRDLARYIDHTLLRPMPPPRTSTRCATRRGASSSPPCA